MSKEVHETERVNKIKDDLRGVISSIAKTAPASDTAKFVSLIESLIDAKIARVYARIGYKNYAAEITDAVSKTTL